MDNYKYLYLAEVRIDGVMYFKPIFEAEKIQEIASQILRNEGKEMKDNKISVSKHILVKKVDYDINEK